MQTCRSQNQKKERTMNYKRLIRWAATLGAAFTLTTASSFAQQITGTPGSPNATITISGKQLPPPDPKFGGGINEIAKDSKPYWPPRVVPPEGCTQRPAHHDGRSGVRCVQHFWRRNSDTNNGSHRKSWIALYAVPLDRAVLSHTRSFNQRAQPPFDGIRCDL